MIVIVFFLMWWVVAWGLIRRYESSSGDCSFYVYNEEKAFVVIMSNLVGILYGVVVAGFLYLVL